MTLGSDELELLFNGSTEREVMRFYDKFEDANDLIHWVRSRKHGKASIHEVGEYEDIVVVVPTKDIRSGNSTNIAQQIFKGLKIIFVESGEDSALFNYSRNCNIGLRRALTYNPDWIILSNDDMYKIDGVEVLKEGLKKMDPEAVKTVFTNPPGRYHSYLTGIGLTTRIRDSFLKANGTLGRMQVKLENKFGIKIVPAYPSIPKRFMTSNNRFFYVTSSFSIFSGEYVKSKDGNVFDELFVNMWEDTDISLEFSGYPANYSFIDYSIGDMIGSSFGNTHARHLRSLVSRVYFNKKHFNLFGSS